MSIVTNGWGGSAISVFGWGAVYIEEYISSIIAEYLANSSAYSCVTERAHVRLQDRDGRIISIRTSPDLVPDRLKGYIASRTYSGLSGRSDVRKLLSVDRARTDVKNRDANYINSRIKEGEIVERSMHQLLSRDDVEAESRSDGWPRESGELCE